MSVKTRSLDGSFVLEVFGLNLWERLESETVDELRALYSKHGVLVFRRQALSEHEFAEFCSLFGSLERTVRADWASSVRPEIGLITNLKDSEGKALGGLGDGEVDWHTDQAYMMNPATGSGLYGIEIANRGGSTSWANLSDAYEALPERLKLAVEGKRGIFSYAKRLANYRAADGKVTEEVKKKTPDVVHSLVHVNPITGKKALYLDPTTTIGIVGMDDASAAALLDELNEFSTRPEFVYTHHWQVGDAILWSNGFLLHRREPFPATERRLMKRATMNLPAEFHIVPEGELAKGRVAA
jgi:taurine dioxygenase